MSQVVDTTIQRAISDVAEIRRVLRRVEGLTEADEAPSVVYLWIYGFCAVAGTALLIAELAFDHVVTSQVYAANLAWRNRFGLIAILAAILVGLALLLTTAIWNAARKSNESFTDFVTRNFVYLRNVSFASDLFSKFAMLSVVILAGRGDWVAPILVLCIGDYLLQGRIFILPTVPALLLGFTLLIVATVQLIWLPGSMLSPIAALLLVSLLSFRCIHARRTEVAAQGSGEQLGMSEFELHPLLGERSRLLIMAALAAAPQPMEFMSLLASVGLTRGNLTVHLRKLEEGGLISVKKAFVDRKPCTTYRCTEEGRTAMKEYLRSVESLLKRM